MEINKLKMDARLFLLSVICLVSVLGQNPNTCSARCRSCQGNATDCSTMGLANPPKDFGKYTSSINLDGNNLRVLGRNSFPKLAHVEVLQIRNNKIRVIKKDSFRNLPQVMTIDLSRNLISRMYSKSFQGANNLRTLTLANNKIRTVTAILDVLPSLFQLNLANNFIRVLHAKTFHKNTNLHYLDLRFNKLQRIHRDTFSGLKYLRYLFLNNNPLAQLPDLNIGSQVLQLIDFSFCNLLKIPQRVPPSVTDLRLGHNDIREIRKRDLENITNLRLLALNNNKINKVAFMAFSKLQKLQEIWLRENSLIYIPRGLPDNLRKLYMDSNQVVQIERVLFSNNSKLEYLTVENNRIQTIKDGALARLRHLKYLNLQGNNLSNISRGMFANIGNLTTLTLSNNPVRKIEKNAFRNLGKLMSLYMSYIPPYENFLLEDNFLPAMPQLEKLGLMGSQSLVESLLRILDDSPTMYNLTEVDLTFNDIKTVPSSIKMRFPNLQALSIDGNYLQCDDKLLWLARWMKSSNVKFFTYEEPRCEEPIKNKGKMLTEIPEKDFTRVQRDYSYYDDYSSKAFQPGEDSPQTNQTEADVKMPERSEKPFRKEISVKPVEKKPKEQPKKPITKSTQLSPSGQVIKKSKAGLSPARRVARPSSLSVPTQASKALKSKQATQTRDAKRANRRRNGRNGRKRRRKRRHRKNDGDGRKRRRRRGKGRKRRRNSMSAAKVQTAV